MALNNGFVPDLESVIESTGPTPQTNGEISVVFSHELQNGMHKHSENHSNSGKRSSIFRLRSRKSSGASCRSSRSVGLSRPELLQCSMTMLPMKNFQQEIRAPMDVDKFLTEAVIVLDVAEDSTLNIVQLLLEKAFGDEDLAIMKEAKDFLFLNDNVQLLSSTIQGTYTEERGGLVHDHSWLCALCTLPTLRRKRLAVARLKHPVNMGNTCQDVRLFMLVMSPAKEKGTKSALETGRTFSTLFADLNFRHMLLNAHSEDDFKSILLKHALDLQAEKIHEKHEESRQATEKEQRGWMVGRDLCDDIRRRLPCYISDYVDGVVGEKTLYKTISTTFFLYFGCLLPAIAFGSLNDNNTNGRIDVRKCILSQAVGSIFFALLGGQPFVILMLTAPLSLYIKVISDICQAFHIDFYAMYACVGLWNAFFLIIYSLFGASKLMQWCTRSTEEIFSLFITIAFCVDAGRNAYENFELHYMSPACTNESILSTWNETINSSSEMLPCQREISVLFLLLMFGTVWLSVTLYNFNKTPYLQARKREILSDYALPIGVLLFSFVGSFVFRAVKMDRFHTMEGYSFERAKVETLDWRMGLGGLGLGFALSVLFFMDQNISAAMVNSPRNKLKKGPAYHLDLLVVGLLNGVLSIFGLPWMHGVLPHSPLHVRCMADIEERVEQGHVFEEIVHSRETRLTAIFANVLIGLSLLLLPYPLGYIPVPVLNGLFLYMAATSLYGNEMFERISLVFTEQSAYPPIHYIRKCPQKKIHMFTGCQVLQLAVLCFFGFAPWPYVQMLFPVIILILLPIRYKVIPKVIEGKYLKVLDGYHQ